MKSKAFFIIFKGLSMNPLKSITSTRYWNFDSDGDLFQMEEDVSDDSTILHSDVKKSLKNIRNINKLIFGRLNINSFRKKFDILGEQVKGSIDIFISETKLDGSFPKGQFLIEGFYSQFRFSFTSCLLKDFMNSF